MTQIVTPTSITSTAKETNIEVTWIVDDTGGNKKFAIQFVNRTNSNDVIKPTGSPFTIETAPAAGKAWTQTVTPPAGVTADTITKDYQAQVMALSDTPADNSNWGKQVYWQFGFSISVKIGTINLTLTQLPGKDVYVLPVSKDDPISLTYSDIETFAANFNLTLPKNFPNGEPITGSLNITRFAIDTKQKLLDFDVMADLDWKIFTGLTLNQIGVSMQRTNGVPIVAN